MNDQAYREATKRQAHECARAYRYEDWIFAIRRDGREYKLPLGTHLIPFPIVKSGLLPNSENITFGYVEW